MPKNSQIIPICAILTCVCVSFSALIVDMYTLFGVLPSSVAFMLVMLVITHFLLTYTKFGRYLYAIGGNTEAANAAGVQVKKIK